MSLKITKSNQGNPWVGFERAPVGAILRYKESANSAESDGLFMKIKFEGSHSSTFHLLRLNDGVVLQPHYLVSCKVQETSTAELVVSH